MNASAGYQPTISTGAGWSPFTIAAILVLLVTGVALYFYSRGPTVPLPASKSGFEDASGVKEMIESFEDASGNKQGFEGNQQEAIAQVQQLLQQLGGMGRMDNQTMMVNKENPKATGIKEGFGGAAHTSPLAPDCSHTSAEGAQLVGMFTKVSTTGDGNDDLRELRVLIGKLSCFKKDLVSPSHIVDATRKKEFVTAHDIEPIAETTGRCFAKTVSPRDLQLSFDKWTARGQELISRCCTSFGLSSKDYDRAQALFQAFIRDVIDIARGGCLQGEPSIAGKPGPRDPHPFEDPSLQEFGTYKGYY